MRVCVYVCASVSKRNSLAERHRSPPTPNQTMETADLFFSPSCSPPAGAYPGWEGRWMVEGSWSSSIYLLLFVLELVVRSLEEAVFLVLRSTIASRTVSFGSKRFLYLRIHWIQKVFVSSFPANFLLPRGYLPRSILGEASRHSTSRRLCL